MSGESSIEKREGAAVEQPERTRSRPTAVPPCDIYETEDGLTILADLPGVSHEGLDLDLNKEVLTISAEVGQEDRSGYESAYADHRPADFQRAFRLSDEIDAGKIEATLGNGVLRLYLPKAAAAKPRKIEVRSN